MAEAGVKATIAWRLGIDPNFEESTRPFKIANSGEARKSCLGEPCFTPSVQKNENLLSLSIGDTYLLRSSNKRTTRALFNIDLVEGFVNIVRFARLCPRFTRPIGFRCAKNGFEVLL